MPKTRNIEDIMQISELYKIFTECGTVTTDSRNCPEGSLFFALKGASFDGNRFATMALEKGCAYAVVDEKEYATDERCILVDDCLATLKALARHHRRQFNIPVIGITGTNGKTTTKELVATVLSRRYNVLFTEGNFNNDIGVPKTLLRLTAAHEIAVIEMGASHPGDIKTLVETVEPDFGLITNVGKAHLQGFGSFEGVVKTKGELYDFLRSRHGAKVFIDADNSHLMGIAGGLDLVKYGCSDDETIAVCGQVERCAPLLEFSWKHKNGSLHHVKTHLIGAYNIKNMLAAATVGLQFGVGEDDICAALQAYVPTNNRSQLEQTPWNKLIVDAYNANPTSMAAAIDNFKRMEVKPKMAILGDMRELGDSSSEEHQKVVEMLSEAQFDCVWLVGEEFSHAESNFRTFKNVDEVKAEIALHRPEGYYILIKGSNGIKLSQLPPLL